MKSNLIKKTSEICLDFNILQVTMLNVNSNGNLVSSMMQPNHGSGHLQSPGNTHPHTHTFNILYCTVLISPPEDAGGLVVDLGFST